MSERLEVTTETKIRILKLILAMRILSYSQTVVLQEILADYRGLNK